MGNFFVELKRRHIYRVTAAYAVVAWVLLQLVANVAPIMQAPAWVAQSFLLLLAFGFPVSIFFAWMRELPAAASASPVKATITDWALIGILILFLGAITYQQLAPSQASVAASKPAGVEAAREAASKPAGVSVAVLPFDNLSGDPNQEFFSDGMTEEITAALAKVPDLRVVARTSAFQFKAQNRDIQSIGEQLHATHFIEGSVRKAGDRVRITAQLIKADDGTHIWAEEYDRELTDIFAIQEDIARAITASLRMPLGLKPGENLVNHRNIDPDSYQDFLRAKALVLSRGAGAAKAVMILEPLVARYPNYAPAWVELASAYNFASRINRNLAPDRRKLAFEAERAKVEMAARRGIALDPNLADGYRMLSGLSSQRGQLLQSDEYYSKSLSLDFENSEALNGRANFLAGVGRLDEALAMRRLLQGLEPFVPVYNGNLAQVLWLLGQNNEAIALNEDRSTNSGVNEDLSRMYASMGRYQEAADFVSRIRDPGFPPEIVTEAVRLLRAAPKKTPAKTDLHLAALSFVYLYVGAPERVLDWYEENAASGVLVLADFSLLWHPSYAPARKTERFKALVRKAGLVEYWRAKGWPDLCHPTTGDDFECS